jgi:hypothetical protein
VDDISGRMISSACPRSPFHSSIQRSHGDLLTRLVIIDSIVVEEGLCPPVLAGRGARRDSSGRRRDDRFRRLAALRSEGILTDEELARKKAEILAET